MNGEKVAVTLRNAIENFIYTKYKYSKRQQKTATNLLLSRSSFALAEHSDLKEFLEEPLKWPAVLEILPYAIRDSVRSYVKEKKVPIEIFQALVKYIEVEFGQQVDIIFPPIFSNQFDRQMHITKILHNKRMTTVEIADQLWISAETIRDDLRGLNDGLRILGQELMVDGLDRSNGGIGFVSTVHPVFLAANLTQVVVLLQGLKSIDGDDIYREYALRLAASIWQELSDYGRERILKVSDFIGIEKDWFLTLEESRQKSVFSSESQCSGINGVGNLAVYLKNETPCFVEIKPGQGDCEFIGPCLIKSVGSDHKMLRIEYDGATLTIPTNSVKRISDQRQDTI